MRFYLEHSTEWGLWHMLSCQNPIRPDPFSDASGNLQ